MKRAGEDTRMLDDRGGRMITLGSDATCVRRHAGARTPQFRSTAGA